MFEKLNTYKKFLDEGTYEGLAFVDESKSRYHSFLHCAEYLSKIQDKTVLELGTARSYVDGKFPGCNLSDIKYWQPDKPFVWDWGAGLFGLMMKFCVPDINHTTLDIIQAHLYRCKDMMDSFSFECNYVCSDSVTFLNTTKNKYSLIYIDTGDMWPIEPTIELQLKEAEAIINNDMLLPGGLLLIDDVLNSTPRRLGRPDIILGKSQKSLPYLLSNGFETVFEGYQYILKKS
jgi:hypothetical protein